MSNNHPNKPTNSSLNSRDSRDSPNKLYVVRKDNSSYSIEEYDPEIVDHRFLPLVKRTSRQQRDGWSSGLQARYEQLLKIAKREEVSKKDIFMLVRWEETFTFKFVRELCNKGLRRIGPKLFTRKLASMKSGKYYQALRLIAFDVNNKMKMRDFKHLNLPRGWLWDYSSRQVMKGRKSGLKLVKTKQQFRKPSCQTAKRLTDPYVSEVMKVKFREVYERCRGWTKAMARTSQLDDLILKFTCMKNTLTSMGKADRLSYDHGVRQAWKAFSMKDTGLHSHRHSPFCLDVCRKFMRSSSSAGYSFPGSTKGQAWTKILDKARAIIEVIEKGKKPMKTPCKPASRGHLSPYFSVVDLKGRNVLVEISPKQRLIFVFPAEQTALETMFSAAYQESLRGRDTPMIRGDNGMERLYNHNWKCHKGWTYVKIDWTGYDFHDVRFVIKEALKIIASNIEFDKDEFNRRRPAKDKKILQKVWEFVCDYIENTPVINTEGEVCEVDGVCSGTNFTQDVDSIGNFIKISAIFHRLGIKIKDMKILGDDGGFWMRNEDLRREHGIMIDDEARRLTEKQEEQLGKLFIKVDIIGKRMFSSELNFLKQKIAAPLQVPKDLLGYDLKAGEWHRDDDTWAKQLLYIERDVDEPMDSFGRIEGNRMIGGCNSAWFLHFRVAFIDTWKDRLDENKTFDPGKPIRKKLRFLLSQNRLEKVAYSKLDIIFCWLRIRYLRKTTLPRAVQAYHGYPCDGRNLLPWHPQEEDKALRAFNKLKSKNF